LTTKYEAGQKALTQVNTLYAGSNERYQELSRTQRAQEEKDGVVRELRQKLADRDTEISDLHMKLKETRNENLIGSLELEQAVTSLKEQLAEKDKEIEKLKKNDKNEKHIRSFKESMAEFKKSLQVKQSMEVTQS